MYKEISLKGRNILLVEDEMMVAMLLESGLERAGGTVISAGHVEQAVLLAEKCEIDIAVLDVNLHGKLSYPVADALIARGIPFIFSTGYGSAQLSTLYPAHPVLPKPYRPSALISALLLILAEQSDVDGTPRKA